MGKKYSSADTVNAITNAFNKNVSQAYNEDCINWSGDTSDTNKKYTEVIAKEILSKHLQKLQKRSNGGEIDEITRNKSYFTETHDCSPLEKAKKYDEEHYAMLLKKQGKIYGIGEILDYQIPLKDKQGDGVGKIDLLAYDREKKILRILELKKPNSKETLLRCVLEGETYKSIVDHDKLKKDFGICENNVKVVACPLIFDTGNPYNNYQEMLGGKLPFLHKLIKKLKQEVFVIGKGFARMK
ncbi:MAG: hypothetical protein Q4E42_04315 [Phascolarctobacterium sp.]|nr:hypothetical protein [Phascolarctobacterium sp.]